MLFGERNFVVLFFFLIFFFPLDWCWTMIDLQYCWSHSKVIQLYIYKYLFFLKLCSHLGYYRIGTDFTGLYSRSLVIMHFKYSVIASLKWVTAAISNMRLVPCMCFRLGPFLFRSPPTKWQPVPGNSFKFSLPISSSTVG